MIIEIEDGSIQENGWESTIHAENFVNEDSIIMSDTINNLINLTKNKLNLQRSYLKNLMKGQRSSEEFTKNFENNKISKIIMN